MTEVKQGSLAGALVNFQSIVPVIPKNQTANIPMKSGGSYSYKYASLADIWEAIREPLKSNGLAVTQMLKSTDTKDFIVTKIWFEGGESESQDFAIPTSGKTPQEVGSVVTYYKRYALGAALGISTEEDDDGVIGNKKPSIVLDESKILPRAKVKINEMLIQMGYTTAESKTSFINSVLNHDTINDLNEADSVMDALENEQ